MNDNGRQDGVETPCDDQKCSCGDDIPVVTTTPKTVDDYELALHTASASLCGIRDRIKYLRDVQSQVVGEINHLTGESHKAKDAFETALDEYINASFDEAMKTDPETNAALEQLN